jgi:hypothetical protein
VAWVCSGPSSSARIKASAKKNELAELQPRLQWPINDGHLSMNDRGVTHIKKTLPIAKQTEKIHIVFTSGCYF